MSRPRTERQHPLVVGSSVGRRWDGSHVRRAAPLSPHHLVTYVRTYTGAACTRRPVWALVDSPPGLLQVLQIHQLRLPASAHGCDCPNTLTRSAAPRPSASGSLHTLRGVGLSTAYNYVHIIYINSAGVRGTPHNSAEWSLRIAQYVCPWLKQIALPFLAYPPCNLMHHFFQTERTRMMFHPITEHTGMLLQPKATVKVRHAVCMA